MMWKLAFRNLFRNKRRTVATGAAIVAGFTGLLLLGGYINRAEKGIKYQAIYLLYRGHISIFKKEGLQRFATKPSFYQLTEDNQKIIEEKLKKYSHEIEWAGKALTGSGLISNGEKSFPFMASGVDTVTLEKSIIHERVKEFARDFITADSDEFVKAIKKDPSSISITAKLGRLIGRQTPFRDLSEEQKSVQLAGMDYYGDLNAVDVTLAASHTTGSAFLEDAGLIASFEYLQQLYNTQGAQYVMVYLINENQISKIVTGLNTVFKNENLPFEAFPFDDTGISPNYVGTMGFLYTMAGFFVFLICGAVALSIVNSLTMGIVERTREIGTFRAIGYKSSQISWMMTQESIWLCILGGFTGITLALIIVFIVNNLNITFNTPGVALPIQFILTVNATLVFTIIAAFLILVSVTSYLVSHFKLKMKIVELLSDSGA